VSHFVDTPELYARTAWGLMAQPGDSRVRRWLDRDGPVDSLARLRSQDSPARLAAELAQLMDPDEDLLEALGAWRACDVPERIEASLKIAGGLGVEVLRPGAAEWPSGVDDLGEYAPHTLWVLGDGSMAGAVQPWVAIVGSRRASSAGVNAVRALVGTEWAGKAGIVSGGALGIDAAAHAAALARGLATIAVLAGGLDSLYPSGNAGLFALIRAKGALMSESPCTERPLPQRFLGRNRIIAALADAVIVVEAAVRSGALNTAGHAAALGRPTGVVPGRWTDPLSAGCWRIVRERHGLVLTEPEDGALLLGSHHRDLASPKPSQN